jgi:hypothetical protein
LETLEDIWVGDLFDRHREAGDLVGYLESVAGRPPIREDGHAHVLAVDTAYGHGKTFFLRRLDRHLRATDHVSAYIDAWVDDLEDQPMVALAATLDRALEPWTEKNSAVANGVANFKSKAGRVAKIVGIGLAKRGAGFLITQGAAEALGDELAKASEATRDSAGDALKDAGAGVVDNVADALEPAMTPSMDARIARFREGQAAIHAMRASLAQVVNALVEAGMKLPITIIVDELDRCRPTYAIKVLEEIKHLFDVQGVAFVLGLHGKQLEHSVTAAYGQGFDGAAYLRRFFSRRYSMKPVSLQPLVQHLINLLGINENLLNHPSVLKRGDGRPTNLQSAELISDYLCAYGLAARDAFGVMEGLHTAMALVGNRSVQVSYLLPLIIAHHMGKNEFLGPTHDPKWMLAFATDPFGREIQEHPLSNFVGRLHSAAQMNDMELSQQINAGDLHARIVTDGGFRGSSKSYHLLQNYPELIRAVARFS